jgi:serine/threonine protein kinase
MPSSPQLAKIILQAVRLFFKINISTIFHFRNIQAYGLAHLHNIGIIHCNIKPNNILLTSNGDARVSDFGLSLIHAEGPVKRGVISFRCVPRWQEFLSPEAVLGHNDPMTDYWALGVTMFLVITGKASLFIVPEDCVAYLSPSSPSLPR